MISTRGGMRMPRDGSQDSITAAASPSDEQLLAGWRHGDRSTLAAIVERHEVRLARIAYRITGCRHEAEDVRHAVFVRLLQSVERLQDLDSVGAWLTRCTVNESVTRVRQRSREGHVIAAVSRVIRSADGDSPLEKLQYAETRERLAAALAHLTPDERALLSLRFDEDLTFRAIAEVLDRPASTVKSQVSQAIARLREVLGASQ